MKAWHQDRKPRSLWFLMISLNTWFSIFSYLSVGKCAPLNIQKHVTGCHFAFIRHFKEKADWLYTVSIPSTTLEKDGGGRCSMVIPTLTIFEFWRILLIHCFPLKRILSVLCQLVMFTLPQPLQLFHSFGKAYQFYLPRLSQFVSSLLQTAMYLSTSHLHYGPLIVNVLPPPTLFKY